MAATTYHPIAKTLHWVTALAVLSMVGVGLWMTGLPLGLLKLQVYSWHKWIGLTVLLLTMARLSWRWRSPPPPLPDTVAPWARRLAPLGHGALLILLLAMPISGWTMSSAAGVPVVWFGAVALPDLMPRDRDLFDALRTIHSALPKLLILAIILHLAAVLHHDLLRRDGILRRMWPLA